MVYRSIEDVKKARRKGISFERMVDEVLKSPGLLNQYEGHLFEILNTAGMQLNPKESIWIDMTSESWRKLPLEKQQSYTSDYQSWYAQQMGFSEPKQIKSLLTSDLEMRLIPPALYLQGSPEDEKGRDENEQQRRVLISRPFWCGTYAVTGAQWNAVMQYDPSYFPGIEQRPVEKVHWLDTQLFCNRSGFRLLTEGEWEYTCRSGTTTAYSFGNELSELPDYAWFSKNANNQTHLVGQKKANAFGLYDMHGNVWEWCSDCYQEFYEAEETDPQGPKSGAGRVIRGGSWSNPAGRCRSAYRFWSEPNRRTSYVGFRVACAID
ncbi:MAG: formylglycine-generating enzyme family protein [Planctomycetota bacterium]